MQILGKKYAYHFPSRLFVGRKLAISMNMQILFDFELLSHYPTSLFILKPLQIFDVIEN